MKKFEDELARIYKDVFYFIISRVNDEEQAKDLTHNVMEIVILKIDTLRKKDSFKPWVMQIARNQINAYYNGIKRFNRMFKTIDFNEENCVDAVGIDLEDLKADVLQKIMTEEDKVNIMLALERIDKKYKDVIRLNIICEYNLIETAEILNENVNTVRTWSARGLKKLKEEFIKLDFGEDK